MCSSSLSVCGQDGVMHDFSNSRLFEFARHVPRQDSVLLDFSTSRRFEFHSTASGRDSVFPDPSNLGRFESSGIPCSPSGFFITAHHVVASSGQPNYVSVRLPVPSRLNMKVWRALLRDYHDNVICEFLEFGWPLGYSLPTLLVFDLRTHRGALNFPVAVADYLHGEILLGRVAGPFAEPPFKDAFVVSPLNTVPKRDSTERRVIVDLSWPSGSSVNDGIPSDSFLGEPLDLTYPTIDAIVDVIVSLGRGCLLYKRDLRKAYRQFPVDPRDYSLLGYTWDGQFYFDTVLTMGLRSAAMACQRSTSAVTWILAERGISVFNYLDDFIGISPPSDANLHFEELGALLKFLGLEESIDKCCPPSPIMTCLGVELNTIALTLSVSPDRLSELDDLLHAWLHKRTTTKQALQSLVGKLIFVSKCVRQSRIFIARILRLLRSVQFNHHHINLNAEFCKDIYWWCRFLREYNGVSMINTANWSSPGEVFSTDTCLRGCGGTSARHYFHAEFPEFILAQGLAINCLELLTIVVALKLWSHLWRGLRLTVRCDNDVAVTALNSGRCRNSFINSCLQEICFLAALHEFELRAVHLPGVLNSDADVLSQWHAHSLAKKQFLFRVKRENLVDVPVPVSFFKLDCSSF